MADESLVCLDKTWQFLQTFIITFKIKYNFWGLIKLYSDILLFIFISTTYFIKFSIYLCSNFFVFKGYLLLCQSVLSLNPDDLFSQSLQSSKGLLTLCVCVRARARMHACVHGRGK
jgi:hypothetical protein